MTEVSANQAENGGKRVSAEAAALIRRVAEPRPVGDSTKAAMLRAWRRLGTWTFNRVKDVWKADQRIRVRAEEMDQLRAATRADKDAVDELAELRARIARLERLLVAADQGAPGADFDTGRDQLLEADGEIGAKDRAVAGPGSGKPADQL